jgi:hypothetical protein
MFMAEMTSHVNAELATVSVAQVTDRSVQDGNSEMLKRHSKLPDPVDEGTTFLRNVLNH